MHSSHVPSLIAPRGSPGKSTHSPSAQNTPLPLADVLEIPERSPAMHSMLSISPTRSSAQRIRGGGTVVGAAGSVANSTSTSTRRVNPNGDRDNKKGKQGWSMSRPDTFHRDDRVWMSESAKRAQMAKEKSGRALRDSLSVSTLSQSVRSFMSVRTAHRSFTGQHTLTKKRLEQHLKQGSVSPHSTPNNPAAEEDMAHDEDMEAIAQERRKLMDIYSTTLSRRHGDGGTISHISTPPSTENLDQLHITKKSHTNECLDPNHSSTRDESFDEEEEDLVAQFYMELKKHIKVHPTEPSSTTTSTINIKANTPKIITTPVTHALKSSQLRQQHLHQKDQKSMAPTTDLAIAAKKNTAAKKSNNLKGFHQRQDNSQHHQQQIQSQQPKFTKTNSRQCDVVGDEEDAARDCIAIAEQHEGVVVVSTVRLAAEEEQHRDAVGDEEDAARDCIAIAEQHGGVVVVSTVRLASEEEQHRDAVGDEEDAARDCIAIAEQHGGLDVSSTAQLSSYNPLFNDSPAAVGSVLRNQLMSVCEGDSMAIVSNVLREGENRLPMDVLRKDGFDSFYVSNGLAEGVNYFLANNKKNIEVAFLNHGDSMGGEYSVGGNLTYDAVGEADKGGLESCGDGFHAQRDTPFSFGGGLHGGSNVADVSLSCITDGLSVSDVLRKGGDDGVSVPAYGYRTGRISLVDDDRSLAPVVDAVAAYTSLESNADLRAQSSERPVVNSASPFDDSTEKKNVFNKIVTEFDNNVSNCNRNNDTTSGVNPPVVADSLSMNRPASWPTRLFGSKMFSGVMTNSPISVEMEPRYEKREVLEHLLGTSSGAGPVGDVNVSSDKALPDEGTTNDKNGAHVVQPTGVVTAYEESAPTVPPCPALTPVHPSIDSKRRRVSINMPNMELHGIDSDDDFMEDVPNTPWGWLLNTLSCCKSRRRYRRIIENHNSDV